MNIFFSRYWYMGADWGTSTADIVYTLRQNILEPIKPTTNPWKVIKEMQRWWRRENKVSTKERLSEVVQRSAYWLHSVCWFGRMQVIFRASSCWYPGRCQESSRHSSSESIRLGVWGWLIRNLTTYIRVPCKDCNSMGGQCDSKPTRVLWKTKAFARTGNPVRGPVHYALNHRFNLAEGFIGRWHKGLSLGQCAPESTDRWTRSHTTILSNEQMLPQKLRRVMFQA